jgi:hypothetical protein
VGPFVLGGVGLVALGAAGVLAIVGHVNVADLREECAPTCAARRVDAVRDQWTVAGILAGAGGAIVVGAVIWLAVDVADSPVDDGAEQAGRARRRPAVTIEPMQAPPGDVGFGLTTRF